MYKIYTYKNLVDEKGLIICRYTEFLKECKEEKELIETCNLLIKENQPFKVDKVG